MQALINLRYMVSRGEHKLCAYSAARFNILARQLKAELVPAWSSTDKFDTVIIGELPFTITDPRGCFTTTAFDVMRKQLESIDQNKHCYYFFNPQPLQYYQNQIKCIESKFPDLDTTKIKEVLLREDKPTVSDKSFSKVIVGDSHSAMEWTSGFDLIDIPGKTLYGWLNNPTDLSHYQEILFQFGSVDLHHHLMSQEDTLELVNRYINYLKSFDSKVTLMSPMATLPDTHQIKRCYQYRGKSFGASYQIRNSNRTLFVKELKAAGFTVQEPKINLVPYDKLNYGVKDLHARIKFYNL